MSQLTSQDKMTTLAKTTSRSQKISSNTTSSRSEQLLLKITSLNKTKETLKKLKEEIEELKKKKSSLSLQYKCLQKHHNTLKLYGKKHCPCPFTNCDYSCKNKADFIDHINVMHIGYDVKECDFCQRRFQTIKNFNRHMRIQLSCKNFVSLNESGAKE
jgi:FtsZ-binding cell division protein ZapB